MPLLSIITICFNAGEALRRTIESVNEQTYLDIEHVIIDGGSTDVSVDLIKNLARRNVRWVSEQDEGIADAFNKGTALTQGNYVCYLNAGDAFVSPQVLTQAASQMERNDPKAAAFFTATSFLQATESNAYTAPPVALKISRGIIRLTTNRLSCREHWQSNIPMISDWYLAWTTNFG